MHVAVFAVPQTAHRFGHAAVAHGHPVGLAELSGLDGGGVGHGARIEVSVRRRLGQSLSASYGIERGARRRRGDRGRRRDRPRDRGRARARERHRDRDPTRRRDCAAAASTGTLDAVMLSFRQGERSPPRYRSRARARPRPRGRSRARQRSRPRPCGDRPQLSPHMFVTGPLARNSRPRKTRAAGLAGRASGGYHTGAMVRVKICGVTSVEAARGSVALGADAIGLNSHPASPRALDVAVARDIVQALGDSALTVGVFVDMPVERRPGAARAGGLWLCAAARCRAARGPGGVPAPRLQGAPGARAGGVARGRALSGGAHPARRLRAGAGRRDRRDLGERVRSGGTGRERQPGQVRMEREAVQVEVLRVKVEGAR